MNSVQVQVLKPGEVAAIVNAANSQTSARTLKRLRKIIAAQGPHSSYSDREALAGAWAAAFYRMNKPHPIDAALKQARDPSREPLDRALALGVLGQLGRSERPERAGAIAAYRPFLSDESPELQLAAVSVNSALWDSEVVDTLKRLAFGDDPRVRLVAYHLVVRYLEYGSDRPAMGSSTLSRTWRATHMMPFDHEGLAEWKSRKKVVASTARTPLCRTSTGVARPLSACHPHPPGGSLRIAPPRAGGRGCSSGAPRMLHARQPLRTPAPGHERAAA